MINQKYSLIFVSVSIWWHIFIFQMIPCLRRTRFQPKPMVFSIILWWETIGNQIVPKQNRPTRKSATAHGGSKSIANLEPPCPISELGGSDFDPTLGNILEVMFHHSSPRRAAPRFDARAIRGCHAWSMGPWHAMHGRCAIPGSPVLQFKINAQYNTYYLYNIKLNPYLSININSLYKYQNMDLF